MNLTNPFNVGDLVELKGANRILVVTETDGESVKVEALDQRDLWWWFNMQSLTMCTRVVSAAILKFGRQGRRILLAKRAEGTTHAGLWCTPGGKVEPGETDEAALIREVREELGFDVWGLRDRVYTHTGERTQGGPFLLSCYTVNHASLIRVQLNPAELSEWGWFGADDLDGLELAPADAANRDALKRLLRKGER